MSEKQALTLTFACGAIALVAAVIGIKLLGGGRELMALTGLLVMCATSWESAGVVMRYADKDRHR
jgi:hypothetical protein